MRANWRDRKKSNGSDLRGLISKWATDQRRSTNIQKKRDDSLLEKRRQSLETKKKSSIFCSDLEKSGQNCCRRPSPLAQHRRRRGKPQPLSPETEEKKETGEGGGLCFFRLGPTTPPRTVGCRRALPESSPPSSLHEPEKQGEAPPALLLATVQLQNDRGRRRTQLLGLFHRLGPAQVGPTRFQKPRFPFGSVLQVGSGHTDPVHAVKPVGMFC